MPLSDHEQRMLDEIESALYAEDPKFASSVRGGALRTPTTRRRLQGAALFMVGLGMLVSGVPFYANVSHGFLVLSVIGFVIMFAGAVFAITGPQLITGHGQSRPSGHNNAGQQRRSKAGGSFTSRMEDRFRRRFDG